MNEADRRAARTEVAPIDLSGAVSPIAETAPYRHLLHSRPSNKLSAIDSLTRKVASTAVGVLAFVGGYMFLFATGCAAVDGVPSWERCVTVMGNPAFSLTDWGLDNTFDILIPLAVALLAGGVTWWLLGLRQIDRT